MKRSRSIRLVLIGGLSAGAVTSCGPADPAKAPVSTSAVYTNNFYLPGIGYYHAPFRAWYHTPYNFYESKSGRYFYGGQWATTPHQSITNISSPTPEAIALVQPPPPRTDVSRSGFGSSSRSHHTWS